MAVKLKIKNSPNKKEPPKREPIVVSDINDPRLKAYQDSLSLHKLGEAELRRFFNGDPGESRGKIRSLQDLNKGTKTYSGEIPKNQLYNTDRDALNSNRNVQKISNIYNRTGILPTEFWANEGFLNYRFKKPVQPVIFKAKEKEKIEKIEPTSKKITFEKLKVSPKKEPSKIKDKELTYKVEYYDPEKKQMTHQMFASEKEGSLFQKGLSSVNQLYGTKGYYVKSPSK